MNGIRQACQRFLRGPVISGVLQRFGIDPVRYWLLIDLFSQLSERGEMMDQLGRDGVAVKTACLFYFVMSALASLLLVFSQPPLAAYAATFLGLTAVILLSVMLNEAGNSLVNPVEGMVLAHQPVNGSTYTAAKLTHLVRLVLYLVPGLNLVPAFAALALPESRGWYPFAHLAGALVLGFVVTLLCCAAFGWLLRFVPAQRLKAAAQLAATIPFVVLAVGPQFARTLVSEEALRRIPEYSGLLRVAAVVFFLSAVAAVVFGLRVLSADFLIRVSELTRGRGTAGARSRTSWMGALAARFFGGQAARAGFHFTGRMMLRDWQFRRQVLPLAAYTMVGMVPALWKGWKMDPFSGDFTPMHFVPHGFGILLLFVCDLMPYSDDYKGAWIFLLAPARAMGGFARGVYALLWLRVVVIPHAILAVVLPAAWGIGHGLLFTGYSLAVASCYLAMDLRFTEGAPFSRQADASRGAVLFPVLIGSSVVMGMLVVLQHFLLFRSEAVLAGAMVVFGAAAIVATRGTLDAFEVSIRHHLALRSAETGRLYREVG